MTQEVRFLSAFVSSYAFSRAGCSWRVLGNGQPARAFPDTLKLYFLYFFPTCGDRRTMHSLDLSTRAGSYCLYRVNALICILLTPRL